MAATLAAPAVAGDAAKPETSTAPVNPAIHVSLGDVWSYETRDDITGDVRAVTTFEVTRATDAEIETRVSQRKQATNQQATRTEIFDARWRMKDDGKFVFQPHLDTTGVPDDLQVGKSWSFKFEAQTKGAASTREIAGVGKVEAWERVTLPSGAAYDAFKIDIAFAPKSTNDGRKHEMHAIMWFAPAVNRLVKRIDESRDNGKLRDATQQTLIKYIPAKKE